MRVMRLFDVLKNSGRNWTLGLSWPFKWTGWRTPLNYFKPEEVEGLMPELIDKLNTARHVAGVPFVITSGKRSPESNEKAMGVETSSHLSGLAVDLSVSDGASRFAILKGLLAAGFVRIGAYDAHVHADLDTTKPQNVLWVGVSH